MSARVSGGLLIVNADDLGLRPEITDAILAVHAAGRISSASVMVHMTDSARAVALAAEAGVALGLHLNLTFPYSAESVPAPGRERQTGLAGYFASGATRLLYDPRMRTVVSDCIRDQLEAFRALAGHAPTHVDGHQHIQTCPTVALAPALADVDHVRLAHTYRRAERGTGRWLGRLAQNGLLRARFDTTREFLAIEDVHPALGGGGLERLAPAARTAVEVMTHPQRPAERAALLDEAWGSALRRYRLGSYADL